MGERAEVTLKKEDETELFATLFTDGLHFIEIFSKSKEENGELEKFLSD